MMDETFFEQLRHDAQHLQYLPDDITVARLTARVRARLTAATVAQPTVAQLLAGWLRPIAAVVAAMAIAATLSVVTESRNHDNPTVDQIAANNTEISVDGVAFGAE
jgi:anti-sigma-K factor RskA